MVNEALGLGHGQESHDGQVNVKLGIHQDRLSDLVGHPTPEQYPITFFEVPEGALPTLEQVRVLHFFNQEFRTVVSISATGESLLSRMALRIQQHGESSFLVRFQERIPNDKAAFNTADRFTGEAQELLASLQDTLSRLSSPESQKLSPAERDQVLQARRTALEKDLKALKVLTDKSHRGEQHTPEEAKSFISLQSTTSELRSSVMYYEMLPLPEAKKIVSEGLDKIVELDARFAKTHSMNLKRQLVVLRAEVEQMQSIVNDYDGYVTRFTSDPVVPEESHRYQVISTQIQEAIDIYLAPDEDGGDTSVRQRLEAIFKMPEAQVVLGE